MQQRCFPLLFARRCIICSRLNCITQLLAKLRIFASAVSLNRVSLCLSFPPSRGYYLNRVATLWTTYFSGCIQFQNWNVRVNAAAHDFYKVSRNEILTFVTLTSSSHPPLSDSFEHLEQAASQLAPRLRNFKASPISIILHASILYETWNYVGESLAT